MHYASSSPKTAVRKAFERYKLDYDKVVAKDRAILEKPLILEFDPYEVDAKFNDVEIATGKPEFSLDCPVHLKYLVKSCKKDIIKTLGLKKADKEYQLLVD